MRSTRYVAGFALALALTAVAACTSDGGSDDGSPSPATPTVSRPSTTEPTTPTGTTTLTGTTATGTTATSTPSAAGCPAGGTGVPAGAASRTTLDVDGDGKPDTAWLAGVGPALLGITTASGATFQTSVTLVGNSQPSALIADVTGSGEAVALVTNGRAVELLRIADCAVAVVTNAQNEPYMFDLGFTGFGTGVGCVDVTGDGVRDLVGLNVERDADGQPSRISRTQVTLNGTKASNGASGDVPITPPALESAQTITCGDATMEKDGLHSN
jgi:hypothetical protein